MNNNRSRLIAWIQSGMDYNAGINLLVEFSGKSFFRSFFTGKEKSLPRKLSYEICKASGVAGLGKWEDFIRDTQLGNAPLTVIQSSSRRQENVQPPKKEIQVPETSISEEEIIGTLPLASYPPVIRRIVYEYVSLFQERSKLHTVMVDLPESNAETVTAKRAELFDMIKSISERITLLYTVKKNFDEKKIIPAEADIFPEEAEEPEEEDLTILDEKSLKTRKKNLQNSNSRDQSMLDYQSVSHGKEKKPMPAGPKRIKLESRMEIRTKKIEAVDMALLIYAGKV